MDHPLRDGVEQRAGAGERGIIAAGHDQEIACLGALHAAADRRVQHRDMLFGEQRVHMPHQRRRVCRVVDIERAGFQVCDKAGGTEADRFHFFRAGQAGRDGIAFGGNRRRRVDPFGAGSEQLLGIGAAEVMHKKPVAGLQQLAGDRRPDIAGPDKPDVHALYPAESDRGWTAGVSPATCGGMRPGRPRSFLRRRPSTARRGGRRCPTGSSACSCR